MPAHHSLEREELEVLSQLFRLAAEPVLDDSVRVADLLDPQFCETYLNALTPALQSPSVMVTASLFSKRYAFLLAAIGCYAMSVFDKQLDLSVGNSLIVWSEPRAKWNPQLGFIRMRTTKPEAGKRDEWRDETIRWLFAGHLAKLWRVMAEAAAIPQDILWENTAVRIYSLYEKRLAKTDDPQAMRRIQEDYAYLIHQAPGTLFGETFNPLAQFFYSDSGDARESQPVRIRKTCCFHYEVSIEEGYCSNCPKRYRSAEDCDRKD